MCSDAPGGVVGIFRARPRFWAGLLIFVAVFYVLAATAPDPGLTWDEAIYIGSAESLIYWAGELPATGLNHQSVTHYWQAQRKIDGVARILPSGDGHPPLGKALIAGCILLTHPWLDMIVAARFGAAIWFALACVLLYLFMERRFGAGAGIFSVGALCLMPRVFAEAHLSSLEMPSLLLWLMTVIAFEKGIKSRTWSVLTGLFFGLAMLTRINAAMLPLILIPWGLIFHRRAALPNVIAMLVVSPLVFVAGWPAFWFRTFDVTWGYISLFAHRFPIPTFYLGHTHFSPAAAGKPGGPWHYPLVMTLVTTPLPILAAAIFGALKVFNRTDRTDRTDKTIFLLFFAALGPLALTALPGAPKYDGIRLFLTAMPFIAALAGIGAAILWRRITERLGRWRALTILAVASAWLVIPIVALHPFQLGYYNLLTGGPWGARRIGMEVTYWGDTFDDRALDEIQRRLPDGGNVALGALGEELCNRYRETGRWPKGVEVTEFDRGNWDLLVVVPRRGWLEANQRPVWDYVNSHEPVWARHLIFGGAPVCMIYERDAAR